MAKTKAMNSFKFLLIGIIFIGIIGFSSAHWYCIDSLPLSDSPDDLSQRPVTEVEISLEGNDVVVEISSEMCYRNRMKNVVKVYFAVGRHEEVCDILFDDGSCGIKWEGRECSLHFWNGKDLARYDVWKKSDAEYDLSLITVDESVCESGQKWIVEKELRIEKGIYDMNYAGNGISLGFQNSNGDNYKSYPSEFTVLEDVEDPECSVEVDCGIDYFEAYCLGDDLYTDDYDYFCSNEKCGLDESRDIITCEYGCSNDKCNDEPEPVCGNDVLEDGEECDDGNNVNGDGCSSSCDIEIITPVCYSDNDCGISVCAGGQNYCSPDVNGDVYHIFFRPTCENAGETNAYCSGYTYPWLIDLCGDDSIDSYCVGDDLYTDSYDSFCLLGSCGSSFMQNIITCEFGCSGDECNDNPGCDVNLVNSSWSSWENSSLCVNNSMSQERSLTRYDERDCGEVANETIYEYEEVSCGEPVCEVILVNSSWSSWRDVGRCDGGEIEQKRLRTQYDSNNCGFVANETIHEYRDDSCRNGGGSRDESGNLCGDLICDIFRGEDEVTCPVDCDESTKQTLVQQLDFSGVDDISVLSLAGEKDYSYVWIFMIIVIILILVILVVIFRL